ncbi:MAG: hypothetical protein QHC67_11080 [Sphingobium sp.]|uniref:hypothetical protein n=1 Tax=Sphingobium sp. TaxID=1912891 RepID=UPI0029AED1F7|nr:hypothetical protein [Sphingobium sp.]MDX3910350.1 hypothetical protein [Sphingobium sp.]
MSGGELARKVKARWPDLRVLPASGYAEEDVEPALPRINKPFRQVELADVLAKMR